ncbi:hypothetical protein [Melioribacter sp. OK-1-Me]
MKNRKDLSERTKIDQNLLNQSATSNVPIGTTQQPHDENLEDI